MPYPRWLENSVISTFDALYGALPQPLPPKQALERARIVSHRGQHDSPQIRENTIAAFDRALESGVWGLEFDIRWTNDLVPVIHHDASLQRVFGRRQMVASLSYAELHRDFPEIPTLEEMVARYGGRCHFMIELKEEHPSKRSHQHDIMKQQLKTLEPVRDYHFLSFNPQLFEHLNFVPKAACFPIGQLNIWQTSQLASRQHFGGIMAHHGLIPTFVIRRHLKAEQRVATGFVDSENVLKRELNRGVEWLFSNRAVQMQQLFNQLKSQNSDNPKKR